MMSVQSNTLGCRLDVDLDPHDPLKAKGTAKFKVEELDIVIDSFDAESVNLRPCNGGQNVRIGQDASICGSHGGSRSASKRE